MAEDAYNTIHFGNIGSNINHINEIELSKKYMKNWYTKTQNLYLRTTNLTKKELNKYYNVEQSGFLTAEQCLEKVEDTPKTEEVKKDSKESKK